MLSWFWTEAKEDLEVELSKVLTEPGTSLMMSGSGACSDTSDMMILFLKSGCLDKRGRFHLWQKASASCVTLDY